MASGNNSPYHTPKQLNENEDKQEILYDSKKNIANTPKLKSHKADTQGTQLISPQKISRIATEPRISISSSYSTTSEDEPDWPCPRPISGSKFKFSTQTYARTKIKSDRSRQSLHHQALDYPLTTASRRPYRSSLAYEYGDHNRNMYIPPYVSKPLLATSIATTTPKASKVHYSRVDSVLSANHSEGEEDSVIAPPTPLPTSTVQRAWKRGLKWLGHRRAGTATETEEEEEEGQVSSEVDESTADGPETSPSSIVVEVPPVETSAAPPPPPSIRVVDTNDVPVLPAGSVDGVGRERTRSLWDMAFRALKSRPSLPKATIDYLKVKPEERVKKISPPWYASTFDIPTTAGGHYKTSTTSNFPFEKHGDGNHEPLLKDTPGVVAPSGGPMAWPRQISRRLSSRHGGRHFKKIRKRLVNKSGSCNIIHSHIPKRKQHFLTDIFTTLLDSKWRWAVIIFTLGFLLSWTLYAIVWWLICFSHGDFDHVGDAEWKPCVNNVVSFTSVFLFSVETQHTIGFGYRYITEECPEAVLVLIVQAITGAMIQGFVTGLIFSKLSRPKKRAVTLMFSRNAVVCTRDGNLCLLVRIGDMRRSHIVDAHTRAYLFRKKVTLEGETLPLNPYNVELGFDSPSRADVGTVNSDKIFLAWPCILVHRMDSPTSPFFDLGADDVRREKYEIVVILEGMIEATGMSMQARTSYLPSEILWGYRFQKLITFIREDGDYMVDYSRFHNTIPVNMPRCSARTLAQLRRKYRNATAPRSRGTETTPGNESSSEAILAHVTDVLAHVTQLLARVRVDQLKSSSNPLPLSPHSTDPPETPL